MCLKKKKKFPKKDTGHKKDMHLCGGAVDKNHSSSPCSSSNVLPLRRL